MEPAAERVLVLSPAVGGRELGVAGGGAEWWLVGRGWREPATRLVQSDPALAARILVVTDPEDPDLVHGSRLGVRVEVRPDVVSRMEQQVRGLAAGDAPSATYAAAHAGGSAAARFPETASTARARAIEATRRLLLAGGLSRREAEVAGLAAEGDDNAQIAAVLFLSPNTVKRHLTHAYRKLGVRHRAGLLMLVHGAAGRADP